MSDQGGQPLTEEDLKNMSEEELQELYLKQYNDEMRQMRVEDLIAQSMLTLVNIGARRAGMVPGAEDERDAVQLQKAIEAAKALLGFVEAELGPDAEQIRQAISQLQMAYVQMQGGEGTAAPAGNPAADQGSDQPGPAESSGRLWVPGQ